MDTKPSKSIIPVFALFLLMLTAWFVVGMIGFVKAVVSKNWPTVSGTVISSQVLRPSGKNTKYTAEVIYTYKVDGKEYQSKKLKATAARGTSEWARNKVEEYPSGKDVIVHYNSKKPDIAIIEPGLQSDNYFMTIAPLFFMIVILLALKKQIENRKNPTETLVSEG